MTYTGNRAPGFQDLSLNPFFQEEQQPVQADDRPAQPRQATPKAAPQQTDAYGNPLEAFFGELGHGFEEIGSGISDFFGGGFDQQPQQQQKTKAGQPAEDEGFDLGSLFDF
jgi:hypothetical protein